MATPEPAAAQPPAPPVPRPGLSAEQQQQLVTATAALLRAAVVGQPAAFPAELAELRDRTVAGAFVSLKRGKHLRSCCGGLGQPGPLGRALEQAAARTAREDHRFPPVSPGELDHLDMEVWLLYNPQPVQAKGEARAEAVTVGRHGVQVVRGQAHGLFLPSVAVHGGWDAYRLLDQVCVKAGLAPTAWREDDTALYTFEGEAVHAPLAGAGGAPLARAGGPCRPTDLPAYADFCRGNLVALLTGATPSYYSWGAADGTVHGLVLTLSSPGDPQALHFSQLSLRPGLPLQATLFGLTQAAAQALAAQRLAPEVLRNLQVGLTVLHDAMLHGTVADPHLAGLEPGRRAALVLERNKSALLFDPGRKPWELLAEAARQAQVSHPTSATVYSFEALSTLPGVSVSTAPRPVRGPAVRAPAVAGSFYDADPARLAQAVDRLLAEAPDGPAGEWSAALVPHAGLRFSGRVAAAVLKRLRIPDTVIVIGPKHTALGMEWAVAPQQTWVIPGATMESDVVLARRLTQAVPGLELDAAAHQREHAIEVELPLLARLAPAAKVVGVAVGHGDLDDCRRIAEGLAGVLRQRATRPLLLVSSDMNHFATDAETRRLDELALAALEGGDPEEVYETVRGHNISMCGLLPAVIVLETLRLLGGGKRPERVGYATSADVTGDPGRVVGYAGLLLG